MHKSVTDAVLRSAIELTVEETEKFEELPDMVVEAAREIGADALHYWRTQAGMMLNTTRERYQQALEVSEDFSDGVVVRMKEDDKLVVAIECGKQSFDLKPGFLKGRPARVIPINPPRDMRTVTSGTDASKWIHPGFTALNLAEETGSYIDDELVPNKLEELFNKL